MKMRSYALLSAAKASSSSFCELRDVALVQKQDRLGWVLMLDDGGRVGELLELDNRLGVCFNFRCFTRFFPIDELVYFRTVDCGFSRDIDASGSVATDDKTN